MDAPRRIIVCLDLSPEAEILCRQAAVVARRFGAQLIGLCCLPRPSTPPSAGFARGSRAIHDVLEHQAADEQALALNCRRAFEALTAPLGVAAAFRQVWDDDLDVAAAVADADLLVVGHPRLRGLPDALTSERLLLCASRPVLLLPVGEARDIGHRVVIGWNGSPAARQAVNRALPLIAAGATATVVIVDDAAPPVSASDLVDSLAGQGVRAEIRQEASEGRSVAGALAAVAGSLSADLLVLGGYSRSAAAERWFGGVTRTLLAAAPLPLLLSHVPGRSPPA